MKILFALILALSFIGCAHKAHKNSYKQLKHAIYGNHRSEQSKVRDVYRHPVETLKFFEVEPNMSVVEISPGGGWYTEILGPYLKNGELYLAIFSEEAPSEYRKDMNKKLKEKINQNKELYGAIHYTTFDVPEVVGPIAPANSVDRVLTFRNFHNWMGAGQANEALKEFYRALKPGGILGIVEHRAKMNKKQDKKAKSGYVREDYVIELAESAGFEFIAKSEINANYNDTANHPEGVWTLPPAMRLKDKERAKYLAIGESDRMTLKFRKPMN